LLCTSDRNFLCMMRKFAKIGCFEIKSFFFQLIWKKCPYIHECNGMIGSCKFSGGLGHFFPLCRHMQAMEHHSVFICLLVCCHIIQIEAGNKKLLALKMIKFFINLSKSFLLSRFSLVIHFSKCIKTIHEYIYF